MTEQEILDLLLPYLRAALERAEDSAEVKKQSLALRDAVDDACDGKPGEVVAAAIWAILVNVCAQAARVGTPPLVQ